MKQANYAVADAVRKAHAKVEDKQKGDTLSLPHNKRASDADAQMPAATNMPEVAEKALQQAVQALHDGAAQGSTKEVTQMKPASNDIGEIPRVVFRVDHRLNGFCFLVDSMDVQKNTIYMYDLVHGGDKEEVPVDFYRTLKPMDPKARDKAVKQITEKLGVNRIVVRDRLLKSHMLERDTDGKVDAKGIDDMKQALLKAVEQFRQAILSA